MFPFKKKQPEAPKPETPHEAVRRRLDETGTRLDEALKEMRRRLEERERHALALVHK